MDGLPQRVQPMGLSNAAPPVGKGQVFKTGGRAGKKPPTPADIRANRKKKMIEKQKIEENRKKALTTDQITETPQKRDMSLGLFVYVTELSSIESIGDILSQATVRSQTLQKTTTTGSLTYKLVEVKARDARFGEIYSITSEYSLSKKKKKMPPNTVYDFKIKISKGGVTKAGIISFFLKSQKILVKGGYFDCTSPDYEGLSSQPSNLFASLFKMYGKSLGSLPSLKRVNTVATLRLGRKFDNKEFKRDTFGKTKIGNLNVVKLVKEKSVPRTVMTLNGNPDNKIMVTVNGVVQVSFKGTITRNELEIYRKKILSFDTLFKKYLKGKVAPAKQFISRSGTRVNDMPAPNVARRGTACPPGRRPDPYSFSGKCPQGTYCKPNPQQQPCCYTIPKKNKTKTADDVRVAYNRVGITIPKRVRDIFGIGNVRKSNKLGKNITKNTPSTKIYTSVTRVRQTNGTMKNVDSIRIGTRQCLRHSKEKLVDIIMRMGYAGTRLGSKSKEELCKLIKDLAKGTNMNNTLNRYIPTFKLKGRNTQLTLKNNTKLVVGRRECSSYSILKLQQICRALDIRISPETPAKEMCKLIGDIREKMHANLQNNKENRRIFVAEKAAKRTNAEDKRQRDVLYKMFITDIEPWARKYENYGARNTIPTLTEFMNKFNMNVLENRVSPITDIRKRGWRKGYGTWLKKYIARLKSWQQNTLDKQKQAAMNLAKMRKKKTAAPKPATFSVDDARKDIIKFRNTIIDKKLHKIFNSKLNTFTNSYRKNVLGMNIEIPLKSRKKAWLDYEKTFSGNIRKYLQKEVSGLAPKKSGNKIRRYELNNKFKLQLGAGRELL